MEGWEKTYGYPQHAGIAMKAHGAAVGWTHRSAVKVER
jgi:hypothetical protein